MLSIINFITFKTTTKSTATQKLSQTTIYCTKNHSGTTTQTSQQNTQEPTNNKAHNKPLKNYHRQQIIDNKPHNNYHKQPITDNKPHDNYQKQPITDNKPPPQATNHH